MNLRKSNKACANRARNAEGKFKFDKTYEDIHMAIENALIAKIGDAGKKLHTGRSRNDQVATDIATVDARRD